MSAEKKMKNVQRLAKLVQEYKALSAEVSDLSDQISRSLLENRTQSSDEYAFAVLGDMERLEDLKQKLADNVNGQNSLRAELPGL